MLVVVGGLRALPHGMARLARGVPTVIAVRMLVSAAFTAVAGLIPLMLVQTHDASTAVAGVSLSVTGCLWALGSWLNSANRVQAEVQRADPGRDRCGPDRRRVARAGAALARRHRAGARACSAWAVAALGMGIVSPTLSTQLLALAPVSEQGRVSAAQGLAISTGVALSTGVVGAVVALRGAADRRPRRSRLLMAGGAACALVAALAAASHRLRRLAWGAWTSGSSPSPSRARPTTTSSPWPGAAEHLGFDGFFRSDHYLHMSGDGTPGPTDAWTTLAGLARDTSRIRLGTLVSSATFRLPGPLAVTVAGVDQMSGGRVELGLGAGWFEQEHAAFGIPFPRSASASTGSRSSSPSSPACGRPAPGGPSTHDGPHYPVRANPGSSAPVQPGA